MKFAVFCLVLVVLQVNCQIHFQNLYITPLQKHKNDKLSLSATNHHHHASPFHLRTKKENASTETPAIAEPPPGEAPFPSSSISGSESKPRCGETFNCTSSGIFHKPFEPILANERCVWTVIVPGASGYAIDVFYLGWDPAQNQSGSQILINGFKRGGPPTEISPTSKGPIVIAEASMLIVTFISGDNPGNTTGFILQYSTLTNSTVPAVAPGSKNQLIRPDTIYLRHPSSSSNYYQNNELSSFVFQPENNIYQGKRSNIVYMRIGLDGASCQDFLDVYGLNVTLSKNGYSSASWTFLGRICGYLDTQLITGDDMIMIVFQTDQGGTNYGFHMTYTTC